MDDRLLDARGWGVEREGGDCGYQRVAPGTFVVELFCIRTTGAARESLTKLRRMNVHKQTRMCSRKTGDA